MIDIHTHILPGIDDGARNLDVSFALIEGEIRQGIKGIVLTPHFYPEKESFEHFLEKRTRALKQLADALDAHPVDVGFRYAAEVHFSPKILDLDLDLLCVNGTKYILIEYPMSHLPSTGKDVLYELSSRGYYPILVHAERYPIENKSNYYTELVDAGVLIQINMESVLPGNYRQKKVLEMIRHNLVHLWGSDTHSMDKRPPRYTECREFLDRKFGPEFLEKCKKNAETVLKGQYVFCEDPIPFKTGLFG